MAQKDFDGLKLQRKKIIQSISESMNITPGNAREILKYLEKVDYLKLEAPLKPNSFNQIEMLVPQRGLLKTVLGMTSIKPGNIIINTYIDWKSFLLSMISTVSSFNSIKEESWFTVAVSLFGVVLAGSNLFEIKITANATAIVLALQKYSAYQEYRLPEEKCKIEANEILKENHYPEMEDQVFVDELTILDRIGCIRIDNAMVILQEKVIAHFG